MRVAGLDAGEVLEIVLPRRPSNGFRVRMRARDDVRRLLRVDSEAVVQTDGIVGTAFIQIGLVATKQQSWTPAAPSPVGIPSSSPN